MLLCSICSVFCANYGPCTDDDGSFVIKYKVHISAAVQGLIVTYMNLDSDRVYSKSEAVHSYFDNILNAINRTLEPFKVQVIGDYGQLTFERLPLGLTPEDICLTKNAVNTIALAAMVRLVCPNTPGLGNRIILYDCADNADNQMPKDTREEYDCGNLTVLHVVRVDKAIKNIADAILEALSKKKSKTDGVLPSKFRKGLCEYVKSCAVNNDLIGKFMEGVVNVRTDLIERIYEIKGSRQ